MGRRLQLLVILGVVGALSWFARAAQHQRVEIPGRVGWITTDPDSLYQMRRVERALDGGLSTLGFDPHMDFPAGSAIPWPPGYTLTLCALLAPFAPRDAEERHAWIERAVASLPIVFSVLASLLAALAARKIAGDGAALIAGALHALCGASIAYGRLGNGDHHAFVSLLIGAVLFAFACALEPDALASPRASAWLGAAMGVLAAWAIGTWVAALMYVVALDLAFGWLIVQHARRPLAGLPALGTAFHVVALAVLLPAVLASPWRHASPWMVINLSWFHAAYLALGAFVFVPLSSPHASANFLRAWPRVVAGALALLAVVLLAFSPELRDAFAWVSRTDEFMARVGESRPLVGPRTGGALFDALGYGSVLLPVAWGVCAWFAFRRGELRMLPWVVAVPLLAVEAARQARFAEALALPFAVVFAVAVVRACARVSWLSRVPTSALAALALTAVALVQWPATARTLERRRAGGDANRYEQPSAIGVRMACEWLRRNAPREPSEAVLAIWTNGHAIEWAGFPSVATNFGSYVGDDGFRAAPRFLMSEDASAADAQLAERQAHWILVDSSLPATLNTLIPLGAPDLRDRYVTPGSEHGGGVKPEWCRTLGARLMFDGGVCGPLGKDASSLERLRLVWVAPLRDPERTLRSPNDFAPAAWLWERVAGAIVEGRGAPGDELALELRVRYPRASREITWNNRAHADANGVARLRVPYATDQPNGEGRVDGDAAWTFGSRRGSVAIPASAVVAGELIELRP